jgi:hypothetical protein
MESTLFIVGGTDGKVRCDETVGRRKGEGRGVGDGLGET